jgi:hypothetical protein
MSKSLKQIYEDTVDDLHKSTVAGFPDTKKRQHVTNTVAVNNITYIPYEESRSLETHAEVISSGHRYQVAMLFTDVQYEPNDTPDVVSFHGSDSQDHHIYAVSAILNNVQVRCTCLDFYFRFSNQDYQNDSLLGAAPAPYRRKTTNRAPVNPANAVGMCKHLIKFADKLKSMQIMVD